MTSVQMTDEGPQSRRSFPRKAVLLCGRFYHGRTAVDCVITNISANGARLLVNQRLEGEMVGALSINRCGMFPGAVVWQGEDQAGLRFFERPERVASLVADALPHCALEVGRPAA